MGAWAVATVRAPHAKKPPGGGFFDVDQGMGTIS